MKKQRAAVPAMPEFKTVEEALAWREVTRRKHRVMTLPEYREWCRAGDWLSSPTVTDAFPGGLTILFVPPILGKIIP